MAKHGSHETVKEKKGHPLLTILLILLVVIIALIACIVISVKREIGGTAGDGSSVTITVDEGSATATIANTLKEAGVIHDSRLFRLYVSNAGVGQTLQYGEFEIPDGASYDEIIAILSETVEAASVRITFPEGSTAMAMAEKLEEEGLCTADEFLDEANNGDFSEYSFWSLIPTDEEDPNRFMKCEGYLFPDTYDFARGASVHEIVGTFYARFQDVVMDGGLYDEMQARGWSLNDAITLASFVQEEAGNEEAAHVAAVFVNRLSEGSRYPLLESNASSYIQSDDDNNYVWNWIRKYYGDWDSIPENIRTAYDTYSVQGLTPGAISNPGLDAIVAAINPDEEYIAEGYYFFVTDKNGTYYYGRTVAEHNKNCRTARAVK